METMYQSVVRILNTPGIRVQTVARDTGLKARWLYKLKGNNKPKRPPSEEIETLYNYLVVRQETAQIWT